MRGIRRHSAWIFHRLGLLAAQHALSRAALEFFALALVVDPSDNANVHHHRGLLFRGLGRTEEALRNFEVSIRLHPEAFWSFQELGSTLVDVGCAAEAEPVLRAGLSEGANRSWLHFHLIRCLLVLGRVQDAFDALIDSMRHPNNNAAAEAFWLEDWVIRELACKANAASLQRALVGYPADSGARLLSSRIQDALGDFANATRSRNIYTDASLRARNPDVQFADPGGGLEPRLPDFLVLGQKKAGTTAVFEYLGQHPDIVLPIVKEIEFFSRKPDAGLDWYRAHFPSLAQDSPALTGEASPSYLVDRRVPGRVRDVLARARFVVLLRDPVERAYSHFQMDRRLGMIDRDWEEVVDSELSELPENSAEFEPDQHYATDTSQYLLNSCAATFLENWLEFFPSGQFLIVDHAMLRRDPRSQLNAICTFLSLRSFAFDCSERVNVGEYVAMAPHTERRLREWFRPHEAALARLLNTAMRGCVA